MPDSANLSRRILLPFTVMLVCVLIARLALAPILTRMLGVHGAWFEGALTGAGIIVGIIVANKVLRIPHRR